MLATERAPFRTIPSPKAGFAAVLALAAAVVAATVATQVVPGSVGQTSVGAPSAGQIEQALIQVRAGERGGLQSAAGVDAALIEVRAGERQPIGASNKADHGPSGVAPNPGTRGLIPQ